VQYNGFIRPILAFRLPKKPKKRCFYRFLKVLALFLYKLRGQIAEKQAYFMYKVTVFTLFSSLPPAAKNLF